MNFVFLDKDGIKQFKNVLNYLIDPNLIINLSQRTRISKKEFRKETIIKSFKNLTAEEKEMLIKEMLEIQSKDKIKIVNEMIEAFKGFKALGEKENIASFLYDLMKGINDKSLERKIFKLIYLNYPPCALKIICETKSKGLKKELCQLCISSNLERGYIYALLNNINIGVPDTLNIRELINEVNNIQSFSKVSVLEEVFMDYKDSDDLIKEINNRIENKHFQTFYTLAKNTELLNYYKLNIDEKEIYLLKWAVDFTEDTKNKVFRQNVLKRNLEPHSTQWLVFLSINLLQMDSQRQKLSIIILNYLLGREDFIEEYSEKIAEDISIFIKQNKQMRDDLLRILGELKITKVFYKIMNIVDEEGLGLIKNKSFKTYISQEISSTKEFEWLSHLEKSQEYTKSKEDLNPKAVIFVLIEKTPIANYELLKLLKQNDENLYLKIMKNFEEVIANKLDGYEKYIRLFISLNYQCMNEDISNIVEQYNNENRGTIISFIKACDSSLELLEKHYMKDVKKAIEKNDHNVINLLQEIEEPHIKNKCSYLVLENLIEKDFDELINIWDNLTLDIAGKIKLKEKILKMIADKEIQLTRKNIAFINEIGIEPVILCNSIEEQSNKQYLLDIWCKSNEFGKIINIVREVMIDDAKSLEDLKEIYALLDNYSISDSTIDLLIKIKAYTVISIELLELDIMSEGSISRLNELSNQLISYGLVDRFLMDKFLQGEIDKRIVDYLFRSFMDSIQSSESWEYYWNYIMEGFKGNKYNLDDGKMEIFFNHLTKSKQGIEWFLDIIDNTNIDNEIHMNILKTLLILLNKRNRIILQNQHEINQIEEEILTTIGKNISKPLSNIEKTIINRTNNIENDILIENLKKLRRELQDVGIATVEDIGNYGRLVKFNIDIHKSSQLIKIDEGIVDSLGVKINDKNILLSTLLNID